jgi:hypothetical protein
VCEILRFTMHPIASQSIAIRFHRAVSWHDASQTWPQNSLLLSGHYCCK